MQISQAIEEYRYGTLNLSPKTQRWYADKLAVFSEWCTAQQITLETIRAPIVRQFLEEMKTRTNRQTGKTISSYTVHGYAQVIKGFLNWCAKEELGVSDRVSKRIELPKVEEKVIEIFTPEQVKAMFAACASKRYSWLGPRDQAILAVFLDTGVRSSELLGLTLDNVHLDAYDAYIKVLGKGKKEREIGMGKRCRQLLHKYISRYRKAHTEEQHVFLGRQGPMQQSGLDEMFERLEEKAHITGVRCSPHTCRHFYAISYLADGGDIYKLSRLLGHSSVKVTEIYLKAFKMREARSGSSVLDNLI